MALTAKQGLFVREYLVDLNATQAAIRAGYSAKTGYAQGHRLLKNAEIAAAIQKGKMTRGAKVEITAERVLRRLARIGFSKADVGPTQVRALELVGKHLGMFTEKIDLTVTLTPAEIRAKLAALLREAKETA